MLAAFGYLAVALARLEPARLLDSISPESWLLTTLAAIGYGLLLMVLARGWGAMADRKSQLRLEDALAIYGPAVIAKYLPGSIFQYAARQVMGAGHGLNQGDMARASMAEAAMHIPAALIAGALLWSGAGVLGLSLGVGAGVAIERMAHSRGWRAAGCQLTFFCGFALVTALLAEHAMGAEQPERLAAMFMVAWIAGFLIPVAPGGLGVREAALLALAGPLDGASMVGVFALLTRLATTLGDLLLGLTAYSLALRRRTNTQASA